MRTREVAGEVLRSILTGTARTSLFTTTLLTLLCVVIGADALVTLSLVDEAERFRRGGGAILTVNAPGAVDGEACEALARVPGVRAAGAIRATDRPIVLSVLPRSPLDLYEASPGFAGVIGARQEKGRGVLAGSEVGAAVGGMSAPADGVMTDRGLVPIDGVYAYPADGRRPGFAWAALAPVAVDGWFDECWLSTWPATSQLRGLAWLAVAPGASAAPDQHREITQLNTRFGAVFEGHTRYSSRATWSAPATAAALGAVLGAVAVRRRRLEFAARLHDGASRAAVVAMVTLEAAAWLIPAAVIAVGAVAALVFGAPAPDAAQMVGSAAVSAAAAVCAGLFGGVLALTRVRERHLFDYFSDR